MLHETRIHFQHGNVKTQFAFCRGAAQFNESAAASPPWLQSTRPLGRVAELESLVLRLYT